jgi:magnesium transporter
MNTSDNDLHTQKRKIALRSLIATGKTAQYLLFLNTYHEADIAEALEDFSFEEKRKFFQHINPEIGADIIEEMTISQQVDLISQLKMESVVKYVKEMEPDDAVDLIEELQHKDHEKATSIINSLPKREAEDIRHLLSYEEGTAGSIMTLEYLSIPEDLVVKEAISIIKKLNPPDNESSYYAFIINKENKLLGYTTLRTLLISDPQTSIKEIRHEFPIIATIDEDQEEIAHQFKKYNLIAMPVVDDEKKLVGLITVDDVIDVVEEEATEDIFKLSGTSDVDEEKIFAGSILYSVVSRTPWLIITVLGGILASYIITVFSSSYDSTLFPLALSLSFIPLLMGLGGNVGNQAAAIFVRGIATEQIKESKYFSHFIKEVFIGFFMGLIISSFVLIINIFISKLSIMFSLIVSLALLGNITMASFLGSLLPLFFKKINIDPAIASAPFISTALDIFGQLIYFSLTLTVLSRLL